MSEIHVVRLRNPDALDLPVIRELFDAAFEDKKFPDIEAVRHWCRWATGDETVGMFVARNGAGYVGLGLVNTETDAWTPAAQICHFWAPKTPDARRALLDHIFDFCLARGVNRIWALNQSHLLDDEYIEVASHGERHTVAGSVRCSVIELAIPDDRGEL